MARVRVEKLVYRGYGLASHGGKALFIPRTAAGDVADVRIVESRRSYDLAAIETLAEASPDRAAPPCPFYLEGCGGCQWQHLHYAAQLKWKERIFIEFLQRGHFPPPFPPVVVYPCEPLHYRTRFRFHLDAAGRPALYRERSHHLVAVDRCLLLPEPLNDLLRQLQRRSWLAGCDSLQIWMDDLGELGLETSPALAGPHLQAARLEIPELRFLHSLSADRMQYRIGNFRFQVGGESFFQTNRFLNFTLHRIVAELLGSGAQLVDLFSGVGFFAIPLSAQFGRVVAVEENPQAAAEVIANAQLNQSANVETVVAKVEEYLRGSGDLFECVLADPPRAGLSKAALRLILQERPRRLVYVSCDPATLVRDIVCLAAHYRVQRFFLLDFFPQTFHFEVVAALRAHE